MVQSYEIRSGNLFVCYGVQIVVDSFNGEYVTDKTESGQFAIEDLDPVSITSDSLKRFNIRLKTNIEDTGFQMWGNDFFRLYLYVGKKIKPRFFLNSWSEQQGIVCESIHHLQGLHSILTQSELELKQPVKSNQK